MKKQPKKRPKRQQKTTKKQPSAKEDCIKNVNKRIREVKKRVERQNRLNAWFIGSLPFPKSRISSKVPVRYAVNPLYLMTYPAFNCLADRIVYRIIYLPFFSAFYSLLSLTHF